MSDYSNSNCLLLLLIDWVKDISNDGNESHRIGKRWTFIILRWNEDFFF